jgi:hypothetical protein
MQAGGHDRELSHPSEASHHRAAVPTQDHGRHATDTTDTTERITTQRYTRCPPTILPVGTI